MRNRRRIMMEDEGSENFWPSFTDLSSTIALILFVLVVLAYIQNLINGKNLEYVRSQLGDTLKRLETSRRQIQGSEQQLRTLAAEIAAGQAQLRLSEQKVVEQQQVIAASNQELDTLRSRLQGIALLRLDVLEKVRKSIEGELGATSSTGSPVVRIAENGNIVINENLVFEYNSYTIKALGKPLLKTLANAFANVLADDAVREHIDVVLVQGHTDERGTVSYNRDLSAKRANAVLNHMFEVNPRLEQSFGSYFASSAYSEFRPLNTEKNEAAFEQNRRIEISVVLKDSSTRTLIDQYLHNLDPMLRAPDPTP